MSESALAGSNGSSFWNHAFIAYVNSNGQTMALDACAGPAVGERSVNDYLTSGIDNVGDRSFKNHANITDTDADATRDGGVQVINNDRPLCTQESLSGISPKILAAEKSRWDKFANEVKVDGSLTVSVNLSEFFSKFSDSASVALAAAGIAQAKYRVHRPRTMVRASGFDFHQAGVDIVTEKAERPQVTLAVRVLPDADAAIKEVDLFVMSLSKELVDLFEQADDKEKPLGHLHLEAKAPNKLNIFVYGNMMVYLDGAADANLIKSLAVKAEALLNDATGEHPKIGEDIRIEVPPGPKKVGDVFDVSIYVSVQQIQQCEHTWG